MSRIAIIIPARLASSRFPAKPLAMITGPDGIARPALSYTWQAGLAASRLLGENCSCYVATDDETIASFARSAGMDVIMTPVSCRNGTERCAAALEKFEEPVDIVVNLQGDAPLTPAAVVYEVVRLLENEPSLAMATAAMPASSAVLEHLQTDAAAGRVGGTTVVCSTSGKALYFSKSIIPHVAHGRAPVRPILLHLGVYAYRPAGLLEYGLLEPAPLELEEGLEQLRFLEAGLEIGVAECAHPGWEMIELNNPADVPPIEAELARRAQQEAQ